MTRAVSMTGNVVARAAIRVPTERATRTATNTLSLPSMSPTRPRMGVAMEALRRYPVSSQAMASDDTCNECSREGSAGMTADCRMLNAMADTARAANVI